MIKQTLRLKVGLQPTWDRSRVKINSWARVGFGTTYLLIGSGSGRRLQTIVGVGSSLGQDVIGSGRAGSGRTG